MTRQPRVTYGLLNLTRRNGNDLSEPLEPGQRYRIKVVMNNVSQQFPAGHRIRLSISTSYWPLAWPPPEAARLSIYTENSTLKLPIRTPQGN